MTPEYAGNKVVIVGHHELLPVEDGDLGQGEAHSRAGDVEPTKAVVRVELDVGGDTPLVHDGVHLADVVLVRLHVPQDGRAEQTGLHRPLLGGDLQPSPVQLHVVIKLHQQPGLATVLGDPNKPRQSLENISPLNFLILTNVTTL